MRVTIDTDENKSMADGPGGLFACLIMFFLIPALICFCFGAVGVTILLLIPCGFLWLLGAIVTKFGQDTAPHDTPYAINPRNRIPVSSRLRAEETEIFIRHRAVSVPSRAGEVTHVYPRRVQPASQPQSVPAPQPALPAVQGWRKVPRGAPRPQYFDFGTDKPQEISAPVETDVIDWSKL